MIAPRRYYSTEIEIMISLMTLESLNLFKFDISCDSIEIPIFSEKSFFPQIYHLIIVLSGFLSEDSYERWVIWCEYLEYTPMSTIPVQESLSIMIESEDIVLRLHAHGDHICHNIHIHRILWENPDLRIKILYILSQERVDRVWGKIPGFTHRGKILRILSLYIRYMRKKR